MSSFPTATAEPRPGRLSPPPAPRSLSLFWRTFFLLAALLLGALVAWLQIFRALEVQPHALQNAQQLASLVNLGRAGLRYADALGRLALIKTLADEEGLEISPRLPTDRHVALRDGMGGDEIVRAVQARLGPGTVVASAVNGQRGFWVGFVIEGDAYWLRADDTRLQPARKATWAFWLAAAGLLSLLGAAMLARLLNQPLRRLAQAMARLRSGKHEPGLLDEQTATTEIRELNIGFNRMAEQLSKVEQDRAVMLAGISHDLRTPLARLRLDAELSVGNPSARAHMVADIEQLDAIIQKFLDYARPQGMRLDKVSLQAIVERAVFAISEDEHIRCTLALAPGLKVLADPVELLRVLSNLLENARRYGRSSDGVARVDIRASATQSWVLLTLADHGPGVPPQLLRELTRPFFRADTSRGQTTGSGLGLAIVEATVLRMGGGFSLSAADTGGLCATIRLRRA